MKGDNHLFLWEIPTKLIFAMGYDFCNLIIRAHSIFTINSIQNLLRINQQNLKDSFIAILMSGLGCSDIKVILQCSVCRPEKLIHNNKIEEFSMTHDTPPL